MEKASGGSFARTTRKTAEDEGRRRGRLGNDAKHILNAGNLPITTTRPAGAPEERRYEQLPVVSRLLPVGRILAIGEPQILP